MSLHLFFKVDRIVYCEGGAQLSMAEVARGGGDNATLDVVFWQRVIAFYAAQKMYHCKSVGSKTTLRSIAQDVAQRGIETVIVCLDRDFDWFLGGAIVHTNVVYSFGYSWENDVITPTAIEALVYRLLANDDETRRLANAAARCVRVFGRRIAKWTETDIALMRRGDPCVLPRGNPLKVVDLAAKPPVLCELRTRRELRELGFARRPRRVCEVAPPEGLRHTFGRLVARYAYQAVLYFVRLRDGGVQLNYDMFMRLAIAETFGAIEGEGLSDLRTYYKGLKTAFS
jgi:hypothetical protein